MLICFPNISADILVNILSNNFCVEHQTLAHFCQMPLPFRISKMICANLICFGAKNVGETNPRGWQAGRLADGLFKF
jgi:hypothetical protein